MKEPVHLFCFSADHANGRITASCTPEPAQQNNNPPNADETNEFETGFFMPGVLGEKGYGKFEQVCVDSYNLWV